MIGYLEGVLREKTPTRVVLDVAGVGYEVFVPLTTFYDLPDEGKTVALRVHTHVREDCLQLFGFRTVRERAVFELLLRTSGVGPKLAQTILSGLPTEELLAAIRSGNGAALRRIPGVGLKTAERIVIDLRDRVDGLLTSEAPAPQAGSPSPLRREDDPADQALSALLNLGYPRPQAERVIEAASAELGADVTIEALIRAALRRLSR